MKENNLNDDTIKKVSTKSFMGGDDDYFTIGTSYTIPKELLRGNSPVPLIIHLETNEVARLESFASADDWFRAVKKTEPGDFLCTIADRLENLNLSKGVEIPLRIDEHRDIAYPLSGVSPFLLFKATFSDNGKAHKFIGCITYKYDTYMHSLENMKKT